MTPVFDLVAGELERRTDLEKLEARGTIRLALKRSGLDARDITSERMGVVIAKILPAELEARGVLDPQGVCEALTRALEDCADAGSGDGSSPEEIFRRLAGD